jgi:hypothetical protein
MNNRKSETSRFHGSANSLAYWQRSIQWLKTSTTPLEFFWLYLAILIATIAFKYTYLNEIYHEGVGVAVDNMVNSTTQVARLTQLTLFFGLDTLEVLILAAAIQLAGWALFRGKMNYFSFFAVFLCVILGGANWLSVQELRTLVSLDSLSISYNWLRENPDLLRDYVASKETIAFFPLALIWSALPIFIRTRMLGKARMDRLHRYLASGFLVSLVLLGFSSFAVVARSSTNIPLPMRGYWSSTLESLLGDGEKNPLEFPVETAAQLELNYDALAYPAGKLVGPRYLVDIPATIRKPRHIIILKLETAPRKYYPLIDDPDLPTFYRMSKHAIVSEHHYANTPFTSWATYAIASGTYPRVGGYVAKFGDFQTDGIASILSRSGYDTLFVDSFKFNWRKDKAHSRMIRNLGFNTLLDTSEDVELNRNGWRKTYAGALAAETKSFSRAIDGIVSAHDHGRKALVYLDTIFGHFDWRTRPGDEGLSNQQKVHNIAKLFDGLVNSLLQSLAKHGLQNDVLILVTGDHGLRYGKEFASLNESMAHTDVEFNVPFLLYAPGLVKSQVRLPYATSHVDIVPTLLWLVGIDSDKFYYHGLNVLDQRLRSRITFMMNTRLTPVDGFHWNGYFFSSNNLTGQATVATNPAGTDSMPIGDGLRSHTNIPPALHNPKTVLDNANELFNASASYFLSRKK